MNSLPNEGGGAIDPVALTQDSLFGGRLRLTQPAKGHRAGTDAVLLAATAPPASGLVVDVGAGVGTVGLALALRHQACRVQLIERDAVFAHCARSNIDANGLGQRVSIVETDVLAALPRRNAGLKNESADLLLTNPPYYDSETVRASRDPLKQGAHVIDGDLTGWLRACVTLLRQGGTLALIHRPTALPHIMAALAGRTGAIKVRAIQPRVGVSASRVLVQAIKGSRMPLELLPPLVLHELSGAWTEEAKALHEGVWLDATPP